MQEAGVYIAATVAVFGALSTFVGVYLSRKSSREANETSDELGEFQILRGVVDALNTEVKRLQENLASANTKADQLNRELEAAQANVAILDAHIRAHIPQVPMPELRRMNIVR